MAAAALRPWLEKEARLERESPSRRDGMSFDMEDHARFKMCQYISRWCEHPKLKIRAHVKQKAMLLFHKWYNAHSFRRYDRFTAALTCLYLSVKIDEELTHYEQRNHNAAKSEQDGAPQVRKRSFPRLIHGIIMASWDVYDEKLTEEDFKMDNEVPRSSYFAKGLNTESGRQLQKTLERVIAAEPALLATMNFELHIDIPLTNFLKIGKEVFNRAFYKWKLSREFGFDLLEDAICSGLCNFMSAREVGGAALLLAVMSPSFIEVEGARPADGFAVLCDEFAAVAELLLNRLYNHICHSVGDVKMKCSKEELGQIYSSQHASGWQRDPLGAAAPAAAIPAAAPAAATDASTLPTAPEGAPSFSSNAGGGVDSTAAGGSSNGAAASKMSFGAGLKTRPAEAPDDGMMVPKRRRVTEE
mmetsp:Transcript_39240/g.122790  ORF Transcript_39240/g.122790 Transcript_39240/m.122790 type:complete len:415 (-) Transcript_39240:2374-3618(-)